MSNTGYTERKKEHKIKFNDRLPFKTKAFLSLKCSFISMDVSKQKGNSFWPDEHWEDVSVQEYFVCCTSRLFSLHWLEEIARHQCY